MFDGVRIHQVAAGSWIRDPANGRWFQLEDGQGAISASGALAWLTPKAYAHIINNTQAISQMENPCAH